MAVPEIMFSSFCCKSAVRPSLNHGLLRAETLGQNLKIRNRKLELGLYACYVYFI